MDFKNEIADAIAKQLGKTKEEIISAIETPPNMSLGDYSFPCFRFAQGKNPNELSKSLAGKIKIKFLNEIKIAGPYINFFINKKIFAGNAVNEALKLKKNYGRIKSKKQKVMVEFSQANTHKAFHVGHIRGTSLGESIARILEFCGQDVIRANYQGDTGMHVAKWIWCCKKYHSKEKPAADEAWIAGIYVDAVKRLAENEKLQEEVDVINQKLDSKKDKELNEFWKKTRKMCLNALEKIYKDLDTKFDRYFFESEVEEKGKAIAKELVKKGIAEISDEAAIIRLDKYNLGVWVLLRKDGTVLYSAKDLALAEEKFNKYKIDRSIYIVGKEQEMHFSQLFKTLELMKFKQAEKCVYIPVNLVRLPTGKMSSRTGDNILYSSFKEELIDAAKKELEKREKLSKTEIEKRALAIAVASMKYGMLSQGISKNIIFNKEEAVRFEGDTGPYLQYSYARASSIIRKAKKKKLEIKNIHDKETALARKIYDFPEIVKKSSDELDPSVIAHYGRELAQAFNEFYNECKVVGSEEEAFRAALVDAFRTTLFNTLYLLGIKALEEM